MRKRILMFLLACIPVACTLFAQSSDTGKKINEIKRSGKCFYSESTLETEKDAGESATLMLANIINDYINEKDLPADKKVKEQDLVNAQKISMKRGPMVRVFVYVNKADFVPVEAAGTAVIEENCKEEPVQEIAQEAVAEVEKATLQPVQEPVVTKEIPQPVAAPAASTTVPAGGDESLRLPVQWQQEAIQSLLEKGTLQEVAAALNRMKVDYKVKRFGTYNECRDVALSFWVVCEKDGSMELITILGPGTDNRVNFKTLQYDSLKSYPGKNAVWFEFAK